MSTVHPLFEIAPPTKTPQPGLHSLQLIPCHVLFAPTRTIPMRLATSHHHSLPHTPGFACTWFIPETTGMSLEELNDEPVPIHMHLTDGKNPKLDPAAQV